MAWDAAKQKTATSDIKAAFKKALMKDNKGNSKWVGFAFAAGKDPKSNILMIHKQKKGMALSKLVLKEMSDAKVAYGMGTVGKLGGKKVFWIEYQKKIAGSDKKMTAALKLLHLPFLVKIAQEDDSGSAPKPPAPAADGAEDEEETHEGSEDPNAAAAAEAEYEAMMAEGDDGDDGDAEEEADGGEGAEQEADASATDADAPEGSADGAPASDDTAPAEQPADANAPRPAVANPGLAQAASVWDRAVTMIHAALEKFKTAVLSEYSAEHPDLVGEITKGLAQVDQIASRLDKRLAAALHEAHEAADGDAQQAALERAKGILTEYLKFASSNPLIGHLANNPFGAPVNIMPIISQVAPAITKAMNDHKSKMMAA